MKDRPASEPHDPACEAADTCKFRNKGNLVIRAGKIDVDALFRALEARNPVGRSAVTTAPESPRAGGDTAIAPVLQWRRPD